MQIIFKNSSGTNKGKQCEQFLSILKKFKFLISTKDRRLNFYVDKCNKKFMISTFAGRNLQDPPAGSPLYFIDYQFGEDIYNLSTFAFQTPIMFCFDIEDIVRLITHYYESKMSILKIEIESDISEGVLQFQVPEQCQGCVPLFVQRISQFPSSKAYDQKDHIQYFPLFELNQQKFQQLKQIQDIKYPCCYQIHQEGIYLKNYTQKIQGNNFLLNKDFLLRYDPVNVKEKLRGNVYVQQADNFLVEEIKIGVKKHYKKMEVRLIVIKRHQMPQVIKCAYIQIQAHLALFPKTIKRVICNCDISAQINCQGFMAQVIQPQLTPVNLLKSQEPVLQGLRKVVMNRWVPRASQYYQERLQSLRQKQGPQHNRDQVLEDTKTRKIFYKLQQQED